jgi:hypothetical protein
MVLRNRHFVCLLLLFLVCGVTLASAATCPTGCTCLTLADAKAKGATTCGKEQILCGYDRLQNPMYCFMVPTPTPTPTPTCPSGCSCMAESTAKEQFGVYEKCQETPCAKVVLGSTTLSYYCFRAKAFPACDAGCECMSEEAAKKEFGTYERCSETVCGQSVTGAPYYCFRALEAVCPEGCSCLSPDEAEKELGTYERCTTTSCGVVPGTNILRYCMRKVETKPCADGCSCLLPETARSWGMTDLCDPSAPPCYIDAGGRAYSCYKNLACPEDCTCLAVDEANELGYTLCGGDKITCGVTDPESMSPLYCYERPVATTCRYDPATDACVGTCPTGERCHLNTIIRDAATGAVTYGECTCKAPATVDTEPPVIDLYVPPDTKENETFTITVRASDPNGVKTIAILVDGQKIGECTGEEECSVSTKLLGGDRTVTVEAVDLTGNRETLSRLARVEHLPIAFCADVSGSVYNYYYDVEALEIVAERFAKVGSSLTGISKTLVFPLETRTFPVSIPQEFTITYSTDCLSAGTWRIRPVYHGFDAARRWIGDWTPAQYVIDTTAEPLGRDDADFTFIDQCIAPLPSSFSWQNYEGKNWLTPVKSQSGCGSCWAFSAVSVVEAMRNIEMGTLENLDLSEQYAVATCGIGGNCGGGHPVSVFNEMRDGCGITDENCFPYTATSSACNRCTDWGSRLWKLNSWQAVGDTTDEIKRALICHGPLSFCSDTWGHCVTLVGYDDSTDEWIIKNSHGLGYGTNGYGRIPYTGHPYSDFREHVWYVQGIRRGPTC